jgi:CRP/FNR family transcriptional regulator, nitrogen oxide reductase regulator
MSIGKAQSVESLKGTLSAYACASFPTSELRHPRLNLAATQIEEMALFCRLSTNENRSILSLARERYFSSGQRIFREGDPASAIFVLLSGRVKLTRFSRSGDQVLLRVIDKEEVVGQLGLSAGSGHTLTAEAMETSRVLSWSIQAFEDLCARIPPLASNSLHIIADSQRALEERFIEQITASAPARLARLLVRLLEKNGCSIHKPARIEGLLRQELAQMIGTTIFTVSRLLNHWERLGIIEAQRETVVINDPRQLVRFAEAIWTNDPMASKSVPKRKRAISTVA